MVIRYEDGCALVAGTASGVVSTATGHPMDTLRIWYQTGKISLQNGPVGLVKSLLRVENGTASKSAASSNVNKNAGVAKVAPPGVGKSTKRPFCASARITPNSAGVVNENTRQVLEAVAKNCEKVEYRMSNILKLYRGILPPLMANGLINAYGFAVYNASCDLLRKHAGITGGPATILGSWSCATAAMPISFGMNYAKVQQQILPVTADRSAKTILTDLVSNPRLWTKRAIMPTWYFDVVQWSVWLGSYRFLQKEVFGPDRKMAAGGVSGVLCCFFAHPFDVLRSRMMFDQNAAWNTGRIRDAAKEIVRQYGWKGFTRGFSLQIVRALPANAVALPVYDLLFESLTGKSMNAD